MTDKSPDSECLLGTYYVVQIEDDWHVLFQPQSLPRQFISVARFQDFERADSYCGIENSMIEDKYCFEPEDIHSITNLSRVPIKAIQVIKPQKQIPDINRPLSDLEKEILSDGAILMRQYPYGASVSDLAEYYGLSGFENRARSAMKTLSARGLMRLEKWPDDKDKRLITLEHERPPMRLSDTEKAILGAVKELRDEDGVCRVSSRTIGQKAGVLTGLVLDALWRMNRKGHLDMLKTDGSTDCRIVEQVQKFGTELENSQ